MPGVLMSVKGRNSAPRRPLLNVLIAGLLLSGLASTSHAQMGVYESVDSFLSRHFGEQPTPSVVWMDQQLRDQVEDVLGHRFGKLRVRYWRDATKSVWILDEIGKEAPITTGIVVTDGVISAVKVLIFRESRGWEVKHDRFAKQFVDARRQQDGGLDRQIDGITGATLSVRAVTRVAEVALLLDAATRPEEAISLRQD